MSYIKHSFDFLVSSNPLLGATAVSADGSTFTINLENNGLDVPKNATNTQLSVVGSEIWYNTPNVVLNKNDKITIIYNGTTIIVAIPTGLYTLAEIAPTIERELKLLAPADAVVSDIVNNHLIKIEAEENQGKVKLTLALTATTTSLSCDFTPTNSIGQVLGFNTIKSGSNFYFSELDPKFNGFNYYLIQSNMVNEGIRVGASFNQIIAKVLVTASPNTQVLYEPANPTLVSAENLAGDRRRSYTFSLLDDTFARIDTRSEHYSLQLRISFYVPVNFTTVN
jgi:hypothetical protein